jgi:hypothetical protein
VASFADVFVFGEDPGTSRRFGLPTVVALAVTCLVAAVLWHPMPKAAPVAGFPNRPVSCTPGTIRGTFVSGGPVDIRALQAATLKEDAQDCGFLIARDPDRGPSPTSAAAVAEARKINAAVQAAICPDPASCSGQQSGADTGVVVRKALRDLGYPVAEVRRAEYDGESPERDVVYGVPLRVTAGCLVSFARRGQGVAPIGPSGTLRNGHCLRRTKGRSCFDRAVALAMVGRPGLAVSSGPVRASLGCTDLLPDLGQGTLYPVVDGVYRVAGTAEQPVGRVFAEFGGDEAGHGLAAEVRDHD